MPWQKWLAEHSLKIKSDGRYFHPVTVASVARQNGKSTYMMARILMGLFHWQESLQVSTAHRLVTSLEQFRAIVQIVESHDDLAKRVKRIRWQHGAEEIETLEGSRFIIKAGGSAARGLSKPESIHMDEIRELHDMETFAAMRYTLMAAKNPQVNCFSTAGDSHSIVLNQLRERGLAAAANPAYGDFLDPEDFAAAARSLPRDEYETKRLNRWVTSSESFLPQGSWEALEDKTLKLDKADPIVIGFDGSFSNDSTAIVACRISDKALFVLGHWERGLDDALTWRVPVEEVEAAMTGICLSHDVREIVCDPFRWQRSMEAWQQMGLPVVEFPQTPSRMVPATSAMYDAVVNGSIKHDGDPRLARHAGNATPYYSRNGLMVRKEARNSLKRIDLFVAAIMAHSRAGTLSTAVGPKPAAAVQLIEL